MIDGAAAGAAVAAVSAVPATICAACVPRSDRDGWPELAQELRTAAATPAIAAVAASVAGIDREPTRHGTSPSARTFYVRLVLRACVSTSAAGLRLAHRPAARRLDKRTQRVEDARIRRNSRVRARRPGP